MKKLTIWQAADGSIFSSAAQCNAYEQSRNLKEYTSREDWLKEIYARMTVHLYKHHLTKVNESGASLLRVKQNYSYKIAYWRKLLDNNKDMWDYTKIPANKPLEEFIYNKHLYQSNESEIAQIYLPERLLTLDLSKGLSWRNFDINKQILHNIKHIKGFHKVKVEYKKVHPTYCYADKPLFLFTLTDKCKLTYLVERYEMLHNIWELQAYSKDKQLPLEVKSNRLIIKIPYVNNQFSS